jgi:co-chaperonin GroES (HSP10)
MTVIEQSGVRIGRKRVDIIPKDATIRPLRDQIVIKPLKWEPSPILAKLGVEIVYQGKTLRGEVLAVGPGHYAKQYNKDRSKSWDSKQFTPCDVKVGDIVELGGLEIRGYAFDELLWGDQPIVVCREADVTGVISA